MASTNPSIDGEPSVDDKNERQPAPKRGPRSQRDRPEQRTEERRHLEALIDETIDESFPASDPPSWTLGIEPSAPREPSSTSEERPMRGFADNIEKLTEANEDYRRVLYTGKNLQLVLMSLKPGEEIGAEVHDDRDQFFRIEAGEAEVVVDETTHRVAADDAVIVPAGARHNVRNVGKTALKLYTIYGPPEHRLDVVHLTKAQAERDHEHFDGKTTE